MKGFEKLKFEACELVLEFYKQNYTDSLGETYSH